MKKYTQQEIDKVSNLLNTDIANCAYPEIYKYTLRIALDDNENDAFLCGFMCANSIFHATQLFIKYTGQTPGAWKKLQIHRPIDNKVIGEHYGM